MQRKSVNGLVSSKKERLPSGVNGAENWPVFRSMLVFTSAEYPIVNEMIALSQISAGLRVPAGKGLLIQAHALERPARWPEAPEASICNVVVMGLVPPSALTMFSSIEPSKRKVKAGRVTSLCGK